DMAQSVERILGKDEVPSSILGISTIKEKASLKREAFLHLSLSKKISSYSLPPIRSSVCSLYFFLLI
ncbi:hypothetical protein ACK349_19720, partial [Aeromonas veronii]